MVGFQAYRAAHFKPPIRHPSDRKAYLKALTVKLEVLTMEQPAELADVAAARRRRR